TIRTQHIDIQFLFSGVDTDIMKFMFHSETNLANTDYRENRSMILSGLSLWEKGSPLHKSTQQVRTQGPIRHCGLQAEKTGRFSLHWRDNTRPDKRSASGSFAFVHQPDAGHSPA
ncbi:hypothetical protein, partial [Escherichia coli]|uniref:hypothetical protein n=1 Tax=Escherichia coli TaxID=562 RepID=UPI00201869E2